MDKPITLSIKDFLIRKMSSEIIIPENTIKLVVNHQFNSILDSMSKCNTIELSGFGKFIFLKKKATITMSNYLGIESNLINILKDDTISPRRRKAMEEKLIMTRENIIALKPKLDED